MNHWIRFALAGICLTSFTNSMGQIKNPVRWTFQAKKVNATTFDVQLTATIDPGWHIYTIDHKGETGLPTAVNFKNNPLASVSGNLKVIGKPVEAVDPSSGEKERFYERTITLVQTVKLKSAVKTTYSGTVEYMACDSKQCLAPTEKEFTISLQ
jgi:thiol:disulfide interchange protein DsbD